MTVESLLWMHPTILSDAVNEEERYLFEAYILDGCTDKTAFRCSKIPPSAVILS